jgi:drug/metabolite transporter (DMT)-like permease
MRDQMIPAILYIIAAFIGAIGQYAYKLGGNKMGTIPVYMNFPLIIGILLFCLVMVLFVVSFKLGGRLSVVYPFYATTFIWGTLLGVFLDKEPVTPAQIFCILLVVLGSGGVAFFAPAGE